MKPRSSGGGGVEIVCVSKMWAPPLLSRVQT